MSTIATLCHGIVAHLTRLGVPTRDNLLSGASEVRIRELTKGLPFVLPRSVVDLYMWSEGVPVLPGKCRVFFPGYSFESLQYTVEVYRELSNAPDYPSFRCGDLQWFPIFRSTGTDFYGVCCEAIESEDGEVVDDYNEGEHRDCVTRPVVAFVSLEAMLRTLLKCYETGVYYVDENGTLVVGIASYFESGPLKGRLKDVDLSSFKKVAREFNPGLKCWE